MLEGKVVIYWKQDNGLDSKHPKQTIWYVEANAPKRILGMYPLEMLAGGCV
jgi:hypothetical protein